MAEIDYRIRPAKSIQRKMLCEAFRKFEKLYNINIKKYQYVGMGAYSFSDFYLFHKILSIKKMISIDRDMTMKKRFELNRPYDCIKMEYGTTNEILPCLDWTKPTLLWLDYTESIKLYMLTDVSTFISNAVSGSILLVTVDAEPKHLTEDMGKNLDEIYEHRKSILEKNIERSNVPLSTQHIDMSKKKLPQTYRKAFMNTINAVISDRNSAIEEQKKISYKQLFNFLYADGAQMLTFGGTIYNEKNKSYFEKRQSDLPEFIRTAEEEYEIEVPLITYKEKHTLDKLMPSSNSKRSVDFLTKDALNQYSKIYRYFPSFVEAEL